MHKNYNLRCTRAVRVAGLSTKTLSVTGINSKICPFKKDMWEIIDYPPELIIGVRKYVLIFHPFAPSPVATPSPPPLEVFVSTSFCVSSFSHRLVELCSGGSSYQSSKFVLGDG